MNWKVQSKYYDTTKQKTIVTIFTDERTMFLQGLLEGDIVRKDDEELINLTLEDVFKTVFVDRAMPEAIQKVDENVKAVEELKTLIETANRVIDSLKAETDKIKTNQDNISKAFVLQENLTVEQKAIIMSQFPNWEVDKDYKSGDVVNYNSQLFKVIQGHKSQSDWTPDKAVSLFTSFKDTTAVEGTTVILDFVQPTGSHDVYMKGDKFRYNGKIYEVLIDNFSWNPDTYPQGVKEITL